jgi:hypothetical protein
VPFSVFPSAYKNKEASETTEVKTEERVTVQGAGRDDRPSPSQDERYTREEIRITEKDRYRPFPEQKEKREEIRVYEDDQYTGVGRNQERIAVDIERTNGSG